MSKKNKPMSVKKFIKKKNKIIKKIVGFNVTPKKQIKNIEAKELNMFNYHCPYCAIYNKSGDCTGCPMDAAGNTCSNTGGTWDKAYKMVCDEKGEGPNHLPKMKKLIKKFNKQFKDK